MSHRVRRRRKTRRTVRRWPHQASTQRLRAVLSNQVESMGSKTTSVVLNSRSTLIPSSISTTLHPALDLLPNTLPCLGKCVPRLTGTPTENPSTMTSTSARRRGVTTMRDRDTATSSEGAPLSSVPTLSLVSIRHHREYCNRQQLQYNGMRPRKKACLL